MWSKSLVVLLLGSVVLLQLAVKLEAACVCNAQGTDYCASCKEHDIVRPKPNYFKTKPDNDLSTPIGDKCWCSKLLIEPAALPKPVCPKHKTPSCGCYKEPAYGSPLPPAPYGTPIANYIDPRDDSPPADPISISLAVQAGKAIAVPEAKLSYGFAQKPIDDLKKIYFSSVPEENLFKLNSDVITLRKQKPYLPKDDEDIYEDEEPSYVGPDEERPQVTYKQLGYIPERFKNPRFRKVRPYAVYVEEENEYRPETAPYEVDCGYRPGRIAPFHRPHKGGCYANKEKLY